MTIVLTPGAVTLPVLAAIYWDGTPAVLDQAFEAGVNKAAERIADIARGNVPVYGINTGFGKLASIKIDAADVATLQRNLILSHCCGVGLPLPEAIVRLILSLKLVSLGRGASGVRLELIRLIEAMLARGVVPVIPEKGSVGASGDLAPLAHMAAVMMGQRALPRSPASWLSMLDRWIIAPLTARSSRHSRAASTVDGSHRLLSGRSRVSPAPWAGD